MRLSLTVFAIVFAGFTAQAEVVTCNFTEPFMQIKVDTKTNTVSYIDPDMQKPSVHKIYEFEYKITDFKVAWYQQGKRRVLEYGYEQRGGSDGMSDFIYPMYGHTWVSGNKLIGGCSTPSVPAVDPDKAAFPGCYEVLTGVYEDGASYYTAINDKIITPLAEGSKTKSLAIFLNSALVVDGYLPITFQMCRSLDEAVK